MQGRESGWVGINLLTKRCRIRRFRYWPAQSLSQLVRSAVNVLRFGMIAYIGSKQAIMPGAGTGKLPGTAEAQVAVGGDTGHDAQSISRKLPFKVVGTDHPVLFIASRSHIEAIVAQAVKLPITTAVVHGLRTGDIEDERLQL